MERSQATRLIALLSDTATPVCGLVERFRSQFSIGERAYALACLSDMITCGFLGHDQQVAAALLLHFECGAVPPLPPRALPNAASPVLRALATAVHSGRSIEFAYALSTAQIPECSELRSTACARDFGDQSDCRAATRVIAVNGAQSGNMRADDALAELLACGCIGELFAPPLLRAPPPVSPVSAGELSGCFVDAPFLPFFMEAYDDGSAAAAALLVRAKGDILSAEEEDAVVRYLRKYPRAAQFSADELAYLIENNGGIAREVAQLDNRVSTQLLGVPVSVASLDLVEYLVAEGRVTQEFVGEYVRGAIRRIAVISDFSERTMTIQVLCQFLLHLVQSGYVLANAMEILEFCCECSRTQSIPEVQELYQALKRGFE